LKELSSHRLLTIHNLAYTFDLVRAAGEAIAEGRFDRFVAEVRDRRAGGSP
jgi:tRNA-guanine family transglycosylase